MSDRHMEYVKIFVRPIRFQWYLDESGTTVTKVVTGNERCLGRWCLLFNVLGTPISQPGLGTCKFTNFSWKKPDNLLIFVFQPARIRGQIGRPDCPIIVSFEKEEDALACLYDQTLMSKVGLGWRFSCILQRSFESRQFTFPSIIIKF